MTLLPRAPRALLRADAIQIQRPTDIAGTVTFQQIFNGRGTLGTPSASQFGGTVVDLDANIDLPLALELGIDIQQADRVATPRGTFTVLAVAQRRLYQRAILRRLG